MTKFQSQFVVAQGIRTRFWRAGSGGVPLVLLHGLGGTVDDWLGTLLPLAQNREVIAYDLLGSGRTDKPTNCSYAPEVMKEHAVSVLGALGLDHVDINGWSLGGRIALDVAHAIPDRVRRLVLTAPAGIGRDTILDLGAPWPELLGQIVSRPSESGFRLIRNAAQNDNSMRLLKFALRRISLVTDTPSRTAFLRQLQGFTGKSGYLEIPRQEILAKLPNIAAPTLAVWGRQDNFAPFSHCSDLAALMPSCEVLALDDCGHAPHIEWPEKYVSAVDKFLK